MDARRGPPPKAARSPSAQARREHRHRGVVSMKHLACTDVAADRFGERGQQEHHLAHPVGHQRAIELDALASIDLALPVQRLVVAEFRDGDVGEQTGPRQPALDGQRRHRGLHDGLAGAAAQLRPDMLDHLEAGGGVFEHFTLVLADTAEDRAAAAGTGAGGFVGDGLTR